MIDWKKYTPYITPEECMCRCGKCDITSAENMDPDFLDVLLELRLSTAIPFNFSSLYRCADHPFEARKKSPGTHYKGQAGDITINNEQGWMLTAAAINHPKVKGIRWHQKGPHASRYIHIDTFNRGFRHIGSY